MGHQVSHTRTGQLSAGIHAVSGATQSHNSEGTNAVTAEAKGLKTSLKHIITFYPSAFKKCSGGMH